MVSSRSSALFGCFGLKEMVAFLAILPPHLIILWIGFYLLHFFGCKSQYYFIHYDLAY